MHYEQCQDEMRSDARFGTTLTDSIIRIRLLAQVDTLGLPAEARRITIRRRNGRPPTITISTEYTERITLPIFGVKLLHFKPTAEEPLCPPPAGAPRRSGRARMQRCGARTR